MAKKKTTKQPARQQLNNKKSGGKSIEESLWDAANKLRGSIEPSEYKHVVLGLIFLKFANDKFEERRKELITEGKEKYLEMKDFYNMKNVFFRVYDKFPFSKKIVILRSKLMDTKAQALAIFEKHFEQWESDPKRMENGYQYESTYVSMMEKPYR
jgi:type I restriction-modification system DNA methylase subunit